MTGTGPQDAGNWRQDAARLIAAAGAVPRWQLWQLVPHDISRHRGRRVDRHVRGPGWVNPRDVGRDEGSRGGSAAHKVRNLLQWLEKRRWARRDGDLVLALDTAALLAWDGHCRADPDQVDEAGDGG